MFSLCVWVPSVEWIRTKITRLDGQPGYHSERKKLDLSLRELFLVLLETPDAVLYSVCPIVVLFSLSNRALFSLPNHALFSLSNRSWLNHSFFSLLDWRLFYYSKFEVACLLSVWLRQRKRHSTKFKLMSSSQALRMMLVIRISTLLPPQPGSPPSTFWHCGV